MTEMVDSIRAALLPVFEKYREKVAFAYLFGSLATGEAGPLSDVDIAVFFLGERETFFDDRLSLHADICRVLRSNEVDLLVLNSASNLIILEDVVRRGIVLYDGDPDLRDDFEVRVLHQAIDFREQRLAVMGM